MKLDFKLNGEEGVAMSAYNPDFWELATGSEYLENLPASRALWFETGEDRERRYAFEEFFGKVKPVVNQLLDSSLTGRQKEVVKLYYLYGKTQEDIATILDLTQSTVSRHLFGTMRRGKKVGGAIPKLRKLIETKDDGQVDDAFVALRGRLAEAV
jgi:ATP/maltotriose-dependent transcriptional regulator MalT